MNSSFRFTIRAIARTSSCRTSTPCKSLSRHSTLALVTPLTYKSAFSTTSRHAQNYPSKEDLPSPGNSSTPSSIIPTKPKSYYDLFPASLASGPPPSGPFTIDTRVLRSEFLKKQQQTHPDLFPPEKRKLAETASAQLNKAYSTLLDPLLRAQYILTLRGYTDPADDETEKMEDQDLLMEVLDANEILEEATEESELDELRTKNKARKEDSVKKLEVLFGKDDLDGAKAEAVRLRYWMNVEESLREWEARKGVVLQH